MISGQERKKKKNVEKVFFEGPKCQVVSKVKNLSDSSSRISKRAWGEKDQI